MKSGFNEMSLVESVAIKFFRIDRDSPKIYRPKATFASDCLVNCLSTFRDWFRALLIPLGHFHFLEDRLIGGREPCRPKSLRRPVMECDRGLAKPSCRTPCEPAAVRPMGIVPTSC